VARTVRRLADEGGDLVGADLQDPRLERVGPGAAEFFRIAGKAFVEEIGLLDSGNARKPGPPLALHRLQPADSGAGDGGTVIGVLAPDDDVALGRPLRLPVEASHPNGGVDRLGPRA